MKTTIKRVTQTLSQATEGTYIGQLSGYVFTATSRLVGDAEDPSATRERAIPELRFELAEGGIRGAAPARITVKGTDAELEIL